MKRIHFISGLPRAGSTLLGAILSQNPALTAGMSSPVFSLVNALLPRLSSANEFHTFIDDDKRRRILRGVFEGWYGDCPDATVFDTNRHWTPKLPLLLELFPEARLVCCVRPLAEIVQSFERLFAASPLQLSRLVNFDPDTTVYSRCDTLMLGSGLVGAPLNGLKEAFYGPHSERLLVVSYRTLAEQPRQVIEAIYDFTGVPHFVHDFESLAFDATDYDAGIGLPGLHAVRPKVSYQPSRLTLPPDLVARMTGPYFWEDPRQQTRADTTLCGDFNAKS